MLDRSRLVPLTLLLIGLTGITISMYLTTVHYARVPLVCSSAGVVNCERVLSSSYSSVAGVPWSVGGIAWFALTSGLALLALWRREPALLQPAQVAWSFVGLGTVLYLIGVEAISLSVLCAWCTALHALVLATLVLSIVRTPSCDEPPAARHVEGRQRRG
jgi:uncharacterized membrane protein